MLQNHKRFISLFLLALLMLVPIAANAEAALDRLTFMPQVYRQGPILPMPTATSIITPTPIILPTQVPMPSPTALVGVPPGESLRFTSYVKKVPMEISVIASEFKTSLQHYWFGPVYPDGFFLVVIANVENLGYYESDYVTHINSFQVEDPDGRRYDLASVFVHLAAEVTYKLPSVYVDIRPGSIVRSVFVFNVPSSNALYHLRAAN